MKTYQGQLHLSTYLTLAASYLLFQGTLLWFFWSRTHFLRNNLVLLPLGMILLWWVYYVSSISKLRVDPDGFDWQRGRVQLRSIWSNISHLGAYNDGNTTTFGFFLKTPVPTTFDPKGRLPGGLIDPKTLDYVPLSGIVPLPVRGFTIDQQALIQTPFGQDLMRWAPQVFQHPLEPS